MPGDFNHQSVLRKEVIDHLRPQSGQNFIDCTLGGGGHTEELLKMVGSKGKVLAFELDQRAIEYNQERLKKYKNNLHIVNANFTKLTEELAKRKKDFPVIHGIVLDLGLSSDQLDKANRGFSFRDEGPLDMRFDPQHQNLTASDIVLEWPEHKLTKIFQEYGEESKARPLARGIIKYRSSLIQKQKFIRTSMLTLTILRILNIKENDLVKFRIHPATKVFQALRIAVNDELNNLTAILPQTVNVLAKSGRLAVISFHSLEDRIVKNYFKKESTDCLCPPNIPICRCHHQAILKIITKKAIRPDFAEIRKNIRSRSASLRVAEKIA